jgi:hypothetical protein
VPFRCIEFWFGGIDIICADSIDDRGDMNLNGLANEIADAVLYTNYFLRRLLLPMLMPTARRLRWVIWFT